MLRHILAFPLICMALSDAAALTLVNAYPATGAVDITGTTVMSKALRNMQNQVTPSTTDALLQHLRQALVSGLETYVDVQRNSRGGGAGAAEALLRSEAATVLFAGSGLTAGTALTALRELQPLALVVTVPTVLVSAAGGSDIAQLILQARRDPRPQQIGIAGERTAGLSLLWQMQRRWPNGLAAVTYNGGNGALRGVLAGQIPAALVPLPAALPFATGRRIRILAIAAPARHDALPAVATFAEAGMPEATAAGWHGLFATPAMPAAEIERIQQALAMTLRSAGSRNAVSALGYGADFRGPAALRMALMEEMLREQQEATATVTGKNPVRHEFSARFPPAALPR